jgi:hypothetical protein
MTTWKPQHRTARQQGRYAAAQLAPSVPVWRNVCPACDHPMLIHRDGRCLTVGCDCGLETP